MDVEFKLLQSKLIYVHTDVSFDQLGRICLE